MKNNKPCLIIIGVLLGFIIFHNPILILMSNLMSEFRTNNKNSLEYIALNEKIEYLEKELDDYEKSYDNLQIYKGQNYVLSKIALRNIYDFYDFLVISTDNIVRTNDAVINENGLVGVIENANKSTAKVKLITGDASVSVKVNNSYGMLGGYDEENKLLIVRNISNYDKINIGDEVTTSGLGKEDAGIKVGKVKQIKNENLEQIVYVESEVDFKNLNYLYVITSEK